MTEPNIERWEDMLPYVRRTRKAVQTIPPPPHPDDSFADYVNQLNKAVEGLNECVDSRVQIQQASEEVV